ncbi:MAG: twin-arginine translocase TatA/TatE family subunit [Thermogemmatispora sp.]|uniref:Sec-independent protein translocase subunit TatA/TatB n=1 Tax=Thermogemmatispora sp. TaxID=1968838 RepID=UPI00261E9EB7|nr:twin-arginine translocase TatA/TatE family subunit [Thermogemmatispora sp.]MBX5456755.1 twin-arginine translocase TatA/TatE family subunit [Thermogemmatispora sp.]
MGFHPVDLLIILLFGLALFGPRALQSVARNLGRGVGQARVVKDKIKEELQVEELSQISENIPRLPLNTREAANLLLKEQKEKRANEGAAQSRASETSEQVVRDSAASA